MKIKYIFLLVALFFSAFAYADFKSDYNAQLVCAANPDLCAVSQAANTADDLTPGVSTYRLGDTIVLPNKEGSFIALVFDKQVFWWNQDIKGFSSTPARNNTRAQIPVPINTPPGNYYFFEISAKVKTEFVNELGRSPWFVLRDVADPTRFENWDSVRGFPVSIK